MRKYLLIAAALLAFSSNAKAQDSSVPAMTAGGAISDTDLFYCAQSAGTTNRKCTPLQLSTYIFGKVSGDLTCSGASCTVTKTSGTAFGALATVTPGANVATALAIAVGSAGGPVVLNGAGGTPSSITLTNAGGTAPSLTAGNVTTNANLSGDVTSSGNTTTLTNAPVIAKVLTGYVSGAGTVSATDSILAAFQKINGNDALKAPLASPTFTGTPAAPTATVGTNTTQLATTAFVIANAGSGTGANPTGTAGPTAVNGSAATFLRSDGAPAVQKASNAQFGIMEGDGSTISCTAGVCAAIGGGSGTVTSVSAGCGTSTGGSAITTTGAVSAALTRRANTATTDTMVSTDCGNVVTESNAASIAVSLPVATTSGFGAGAFFEVCNIGVGTATITPTTSTIGGASTLVIPGGSAAAPVCASFQSDGTNYNIVQIWETNASLLNAGTLPAARLPNPSASTLGGIESLASTTHQWINTISTSGVPSSSQPACGDLSNAGTACQAATGTSGATVGLLNGNNTFSGNNSHTGAETFAEVIGTINTQVGTTYTLAATDCGKTVLITNASAITLTTLNSIPAGCSISVEQGGAGQITVANGSGATLTSAHSYTKTFNATGAIIGLFVDTNTGTNAHYVLTGDGA